jgi:hypothetical protein
MKAGVDSNNARDELPDTLVLEAPVSEGSVARGLVFALAAALLVGGCIGALARGSLAPLGFVLIGIAIYTWLFRTEPRVSYVEYFRLDASGVSFVHTPGQRGRVSRYAWSQIEGVSARLATHGEEIPGLVLRLRSAEGGRELVLPVTGDADRMRACSLAQAWLATRF